MNELVSVLMPVYNGMPLIKASVESLLNQTYKNWECIIVDDGSTDGTSDYLDSLSDNRFVVNHFEHNLGRPFARQKALEMAKGYFIAMLDAEDLYAPKKLEMQVDTFIEHPEVCLVSTGMCSFGSKTELLRVRGATNNKTTKFNGNNAPAHATCMLIRERAIKYQFDPFMKLGQDVDFLTRYLSGGVFYELNDVLYYYSEYDSVNKKKIRRTYYLMMVNNFKKRRFKDCFLYLLKLFYSYLVFPFLTIEHILKKRGRELSERELLEFNRNCKAIIKKYSK